MTEWSDLTLEERQRFLRVLEGMLRGAVAEQLSPRGTEFDIFMEKALKAAMRELRKVDAS